MLCSSAAIPLKVVSFLFSSGGHGGAADAKQSAFMTSLGTSIKITVGERNNTKRLIHILSALYFSIRLHVRHAVEECSRYGVGILGFFDCLKSQSIVESFKLTLLCIWTFAVAPNYVALFLALLAYCCRQQSRFFKHHLSLVGNNVGSEDYSSVSYLLCLVAISCRHTVSRMAWNATLSSSFC